jgi:hypothetical protein
MAFDPKAHLIELRRRVKDPATGQYVTRVDQYLEVRWRIYWFREQCPHGTIETQEMLIDVDRGYARMRAIVADGNGGKAEGTGTETAASFGDYVEKAETRAIGRALAALGYGTQFAGEELSEGEHVADAPVARAEAAHGNGDAGPLPAGEASAARLTIAQARELKRLAGATFGYPEGMRRLRADLGFAVNESLTLRHLAAHVTAAQYAALMAAYEAELRQAVEADVP